MSYCIVLYLFLMPAHPSSIFRPTDNADGRAPAPAVSSGAAVVLSGRNERWLKAEAVPSGLTTAGLTGMRRVCRPHVNVCVYAALVATDSVGLSTRSPETLAERAEAADPAACNCSARCGRRIWVTQCQQESLFIPKSSAGVISFILT